MDLVEPYYNTAVACMRLQTPYLHAVHREILDHLVEHHEKVIIFLGIAPILCSVANPLTFEQRRHMLQQDYPSIIVLKDVAIPDDTIWSKNLDKDIKALLTPADTVCLYGGRDSFIPHYSGKFPTREFVQTSTISGAEIRRGISKASINSDDFRKGVVWASANRFPTCYPTVDVAIFNEDSSEILLARKEHEKLFRLVGGFADPGSPSYEVDARREVAEETNIEIGDLRYVASALIPDWRYEGEPDCIKTLLFRATYTFGVPRAQDDICELRWFKVKDLKPSAVVPTHHEILAMVLKAEVGIDI